MSVEPRSRNHSNYKKSDRGNSKRLTELSEFLKSCRRRTNPEVFQLPARPRRRNPGLSRTEVADLAGISVDWYTWLEQGRNINPSVDVLNKLAEVFQLTEPERRYLYSLTDYTPIATEAPDADIQLMQRMISHMSNAPALILRKDWQILAQNDCADKFFGTWSHVEEKDKNVLYLFFTEPIFTQYLRQWKWHAKLAIRQYRVTYATEIDNPTFVSLIERLNNVSPQFRKWWAETDVTGRDDGHKEFDHPSLGYLNYDYTILRPAENQAIEVIAFIPRTTKTNRQAARDRD